MKTLVDALVERYSDIDKTFGEDLDIRIEFHLPAFSPKKTGSGHIIAASSIVLYGENISSIGSEAYITKACQYVKDIDLSHNEIQDLSEVFILLNCVPDLISLNISHNAFSSNSIEWPETGWSSLKCLILNCIERNFFDSVDLQRLIELLPSLKELHLSGNKLANIDFSSSFKHDNIQTLFICANNFSQWEEICKFGNAFPNLTQLTASCNPFHNFKTNSPMLCSAACFKNLRHFFMNETLIDDWSAIESLNDFPNLENVRITSIPLIESLSPADKRTFLVVYINRFLTLNGTIITEKEIENCERRFMHYHANIDNKPKKYFLLADKYKELVNVSDDLDQQSTNVKTNILFNETTYACVVDVRFTTQTFFELVSDLIGYPVKEIRVKRFDSATYNKETCEELKPSQRTLLSYDVRENDHFYVELDSFDKKMQSPELDSDDVTPCKLESDGISHLSSPVTRKLF